MLEDLLLKDNEENRKQQRDLDAEAVNIQNKPSKKKKSESSRRLSDKNRLSGDGSEEGSVEPSLIEDPEDSEIQFNCTRDKISEDRDTDSLTEPSDSPNKLNFLDELQMMKNEPVDIDEPEDVCTEILPLNLPDSLKKSLEHDYTMVNSRRRLVKLPAQPNIVILLENFVRHFAVQKLGQLEKQLSKSMYSQFTKINSEKEAEKYEEALNQINICKEVAEGVRIIVDFQLGNILLYRREENQYSKSSQITPLQENIQSRGSISETPGRRHGASESESVEAGASGVSGRKRTRLSSNVKEELNNGLVAGSVGSTSSGTMTPTLPGAGLTTGHYPQSSKSHIILEQLWSWKLVPDTLYLETPVPASLVYGGVHLARLLVKIPEILSKMRFSSKNAKRITKYLEYLTDFISNQQDIFSDNNYQ